MTPPSDKPKIGMAKRRPVGGAETIVDVAPLQPGQTLPLLIRPATDDVDLAGWSAQHRDWIASQLLQHGGILFRGFAVSEIAAFEQVVRSVAAGDLLDYTYRSTPRSQVSGNIYTSTEYPADQHIPLHNEMSYTRNWPMKIWFYCVRVAEQGGETPIADSHAVLARIDPRIVEQFAQRQVMYVRNYGQGLDLSWQSVFQTDDPAAVEQFCQSAGIVWEWRDGGRGLRTSQVCQAVAAHPQTGQLLWFNQAHLFHISSLPPEVRRALLAEFAEADLPRNVYYGDGAPIEDAVLEQIRAAFAQETVSFPWQERDILMLDNMRVAHGRAPFSGARRVVVAMAEPFARSAMLT